MPRSTTRIAFLAIALVALVAILGFQFAESFDDAKIFRPVDYMEYDAAARATLAGRNAYDGAVIYEYQLRIQAKLPPIGNEAGGVTQYADPIMMWNPPWTLPLALPLGLVHWRAGQLIWTAANLLAVILSGVLLGKIYGGRTGQFQIAAALSLAFAPTIFLLMLGQISGFLLLGIVGFLWNLRNGRYAFAGCCAALTAIKPHLFLLFASVLILESLRGRKVWRSVIAGAFALVGFALLPLMWNPEVWSQYREASSANAAGTHNTLSDWIHPTLGYWLRTQLPGSPFSAMFIPLAIAAPLTAIYWWFRRRDWKWETELPRLVLGSLVAAPYGAWGFDLVVLLVPVIHAASLLSRSPNKILRAKFFFAYFALNLFALLSLRFANSMCNAWYAPATVCLYALAVWQTSKVKATMIHSTPTPTLGVLA